MNINVLFYVDAGLTDDELTFINSYLPETLSDKIKSNNNINEIYYSLPTGYNGKLLKNENSIIRDEESDLEKWKKIFSKTGSNHIIKIFADSPLMDTSIIGEMLDVHLKYLAEFTFSENLPQGLSAEIISKELVDILPELEQQSLPLEDIIKKNINQFDVEIYYKEPGLRDKRISFRSGNKRDKIIMENIFSIKSKIPVYSELKNLIENNPGLLFISPSYLEIEITGNCELDCTFCYRNSLDNYHKDIDISIYEKILKQMQMFNIPYTICMGGSGEPFEHDNFYKLLELTVNDPLVEQLIIETNGINADSGYKTFLEKSNLKNIKTIININGFNIETYESIHKKDYFQRLLDNIESLKSLPLYKDKIYLQIMKINETESFLDKYYDFWEKLELPIILQKHNSYLGKIEDKNYSDLSPIERIPCWHLQRDLYILADGRVSFCKQDIGGENSVGNLKDETLNEIWDNKKDSG